MCWWPSYNSRISSIVPTASIDSLKSAEGTKARGEDRMFMAIRGAVNYLPQDAGSTPPVPFYSVCRKKLGAARFAHVLCRLAVIRFDWLVRTVGGRSPCLAAISVPGPQCRICPRPARRKSSASRGITAALLIVRSQSLIGYPGRSGHLTLPVKGCAEPAAVVDLILCGGSGRNYPVRTNCYGRSSRPG
jgi:hypothetical protein